jgi:hypothetical protein
VHLRHTLEETTSSPKYEWFLPIDSEEALSAFAAMYPHLPTDTPTDDDDEDVSTSSSSVVRFCPPKHTVAVPFLVS